MTHPDTAADTTTLTDIRPLTADQQEFAALTGTHWIRASSPSDAVTVPGAPGTWYTADGAVIGTGLPDNPQGQVRLAPGDRIVDGGRVLAGHARAGVAALRTFDRDSGGSCSVTGIEVFGQDDAWVVEAEFTADPQTVTVISADGVEGPGEVVGRLSFSVPGDAPGESHRLQVTEQNGDYFVSFGDAAAQAGTHPFRFLNVPAADPDGHTTIDFNAAWLPASAFSDAYLCPLPSAVNVLDVAVPAGEKRVVRR
ncbi:DUF1684 domain-containing protein [Corynebacterium variabile]|uniref:DUF1684 domain-containing protein n=1 Tax=Corynebacterium variabile TaxID=1727 RepID=UPI003FD1A54E